MNSAFYYDLGSPECYLAAERILHTVPGPCEWRPVLAADLPGGLGLGPWRCCEEREIQLAEIERAAAARGLQPVRWPDELPFDSTFAMRVATYARQIGRAVAFSLAAFRQAYAGGRTLADPDNVLVAASACEMHPKAILRAAELRSVRHELDATTAQAAENGVMSVPALWIAGEVFHGDRSLETAAAALAGA